MPGLSLFFGAPRCLPLRLLHGEDALRLNATVPCSSLSGDRNPDTVAGYTTRNPPIARLRWEDRWENRRWGAALIGRGQRCREGQAAVWASA